MMKIAITGTIGSGKSTVSAYLRNKGYAVFDCDRTNSELLKPGNKGYNALIKAFSDEILNEDQTIDRKRLSAIVFNDSKQLKILNSIMHPLIREEMLIEMNRNNLFIAEVPLLFETDFYQLFDYKLLIVADYDIAIERLIKRGLSEDDAISRIKNQMDVEEKIRKSDYIIDNNQGLNELYQKIDEWMVIMNDWQ